MQGLDWYLGTTLNFTVDALIGGEQTLILKETKGTSRFYEASCKVARVIKIEEKEGNINIYYCRF